MSVIVGVSDMGQVTPDTWRKKYFCIAATQTCNFFYTNKVWALIILPKKVRKLWEKKVNLQQTKNRVNHNLNGEWGRREQKKTATHVY